MFRLIIYILSNALGIWAATRLVSGVHFYGDWKWLILAGAVLGIINFFVKPVVKIISLPLIWLSLGLFTVVINILMLELAARILGILVIDSWLAAFWAVVVISIVNYVVLSLTREEN